MLLNKDIMILNKLLGPEYICLWTSGHNEIVTKYYKNYFPFNWMDLVDIENEKIYYVEFMGIDTFKIYKIEDYIHPDYIEGIRTGDVKLMLHFTGHGYHEIVEQLYEHVIIRDKVPLHNLILSSESWDMDKAVEWASKKYNLSPIRTRVTLEFEAYANDYTKTMVNYLDGACKDAVYIDQFKFQYKNYDKKYICLNGFWRDHRAAIVFFMASYGLLDKGYTSYNIKDSGGNSTGKNTYENLINRMGHIPEIFEILEQNKEKLYKINHILLDTEYNDYSQNLAQIKHEHNIWFNDTYFSLLTETNFPTMYQKNFEFDPDRFYDLIGRLYSEKIFRCIVYKHPFIATGPKHFLKILHWLGYKTFHPIIDESYDDETDDAKRLFMIANEAKKLCGLDEQGLKKFLEFTKEICDHNFEVLKNRNKFVYDLPIPNL